MVDYDAVVVGAGPAGLTAALYLARGKHRVLVVSEKIFDGPVGLLELIENYPGFPDGVSGGELIDAMVTQASNYDVEFETDRVSSVEKTEDTFVTALDSGEKITSKILVAASGSRHRKLNVPGESELTDHGVFNCAFCDGGKFIGKPVVVVGGGDAGITEALYLSKLASHVYVLEFLPQLKATAVLQDKVYEAENITVQCGVSVTEILGEGVVSGVRVKAGTGDSETIDAEGVLVDIGLLPNTSYLSELISLEKSGHVSVNEQMATSIDGLFVVGDIRTSSPGQISSAVGDGAAAGIHAIRLLQQLE
ncbi:MAG: NAD(P)/FAD-dependent oxidoreductase [Clostridiales Family XIII bacterium]|jgi:thioredoxin reductase (NADPH)|nr:NAD(P)/FAD-dependent oxidoreductase [Clostridiales Family XIII bacterium]